MPKGSQNVTAGGDLHPALKIISGRDYSIIKYACKYPNVSDDNLPYRHIRSLPIQEKNRHIGSYLKNAEANRGLLHEKRRLHSEQNGLYPSRCSPPHQVLY